MDLMARYGDNYFDLAIVDPPYGINYDKGQNAAAESRKKANGKSKAGRGWKEYKATEWDSEIPTKEYFKELFRVSKNQIVWGANYMCSLLPSGNGWIYWNKNNGDNNKFSDGEFAFSSKGIQSRHFKISAFDNLRGGRDRIHPTEKPVKLYEWLLINYAKEGDKILDTHLGSGSIAIACHNLGFELTACELDKDYYQAAIKRIKQHKAQIRMF
tara:strand:- start:27 stop:665 length:639 start_codon:yes stop_codon:yes gene_type:complete